MENIFDRFHTEEQPIEEVEEDLKCQHLGFIPTKWVDAPDGTHGHMGSVCEDCGEVLSYVATHCTKCGPLP